MNRLSHKPSEACWLCHVQSEKLTTPSPIPSVRCRSFVIRSRLHLSPITKRIGLSPQSDYDLPTAIPDNYHPNIPLTSMTKPTKLGPPAHPIRNTRSLSPQISAFVSPALQEKPRYSRVTNACFSKHAIDLRRSIWYSECQKASFGWHLGVQHQARRWHAWMTCQDS